MHGESVALRVGEKLRLPLWSNRKHGHLHYEWRLIERPTGSRATVDQTTGESRDSTEQCERVYYDGTVPHFTPDVPGRFVFEVRAVEVLTGQEASGRGVVVASATRPNSGSGCTAAAGSPLLLAGALWALRRRRRTAFR